MPDEVIVIRATDPEAPATVVVSRTGTPGPVSSLTIGTIATGNPGTSATASITGTAPDQTLNLTLPRGDKGDPGLDGLDGPPNTLAVGAVSTLPAGSTATASISGTAPNQTLDLAIPQGNQGDKGDKGDPGNPGPANTLSIGTVSTGAAGSSASATIAGTAPNQTLDLSIPKGDQGDKGDPGAPNTLAIGTVDTLTPGSSATASITGTAPNQTLDLGLPQGTKGDQGDPGLKGDPGPANTLSIGTVSTLPAGSTATASVTGTAPAQTLDLGIPQGGKGDQGNPGPANTLAVGTVTTGAAGSAAAASITGTAPNQTLDLTIPEGAKGDQGNPGPANTLTVGTVSTLPAGDPATATVSGAAPNQTLDLGIPQGPQGGAGPANSLSIGTVTTGAAGTAASASITGAAPAQTLNLTVPQGVKGDTGVGVPAGGSTGQALVKSSSTDYDAAWATVSSGGGGSGNMNYQGDYSRANAYSVDDVVRYNNKLYVCSSAVSANTMPVYRGTTTGNVTTAATNVSLPTGTQNGDLLVAWVVGVVTGFSPTYEPSVPSGFTVQNQGNINFNSGTLSYGWVAATYTITASDVANGYIAFPAGSGQQGAEVALVAFGNANLDGTVHYSSNSLSVSSMAYATTDAFALDLAFQGGNGTTSMACAALADVHSAQSNTTVGSPVIATGYSALSGSGTTAANTFTVTGSTYGSKGSASLIISQQDFPIGSFTEIGAYGAQVEPTARIVKGSTTITSQDSTLFVPSGVTGTLTLPDAATSTGYRYTVQWITSAKKVSLTGVNGQTIAGLGTLYLSDQDVNSAGSALVASVTVESDGTNWQIISTARSLNTFTISGGFTAQPGDVFVPLLVFANNSSPSTYTLPDAKVVLGGSRIIFANTSGGTTKGVPITIAAASSQNIDSNASVIVPARRYVTFESQPGGSWAIVGSSGPLHSVVSVSANYTLVMADLQYERPILASGTITITLPDAVYYSSLKAVIKNVGTGTVTVVPTYSNEPIDGATSVTLSQYQTLRVISDGAAWWTI